MVKRGKIIRVAKPEMKFCCTYGHPKVYTNTGWKVYLENEEGFWNGQYCCSDTCLAKESPQHYRELVEKGLIW